MPVSSRQDWNGIILDQFSILFWQAACQAVSHPVVPAGRRPAEGHLTGSTSDGTLTSVCAGEFQARFRSPAQLETQVESLSHVRTESRLDGSRRGPRRGLR